MIGKNDTSINPSYNHLLTFGKGDPSNNAGLWCIHGSCYKGFLIARAFNMGITTNSSSQTGGQRAIFIDSNMHIGMDRYQTAISQNHTLDVGGKIRAEAYHTLSDSRYKRDIEPISNTSGIFKLDAVQYKPSGEAFEEQLQMLKGQLNDTDYAIAEANYKRIIADRNSSDAIDFGFIAQDLRTIYPNLVDEDQNGFLSVNYVGLIPVLVDAIKELKQEINDLRGSNARPSIPEFISSAKLYQNNPNPFTDNTEIKFYIPSESVDASIRIYDLVGSEILKFDIADRGTSAITIYGSQLKAGMYLYSLLIDGKEIDTKKMILTNNN